MVTQPSRRSMLSAGAAALATLTIPAAALAAHGSPDPAIAACAAWRQAWADLDVVLIRWGDAGEPDDGPLYEAQEAAQDRHMELLGRISETAATSAAGIVAKLRLCRGDLAQFQAADDILDSAIADLRRLAGSIT